MRILLFSVAILVTAAPWLRAQVTVPMSQYDYERTGANLSEWILSPSTVNSARFGKIFSRSVDDSVYALPLIVPNLDISGQRRNVLFVATMGNTVYAFDADDPARVEPYWSKKSWNTGSGRQLDRARSPWHPRNAFYRCTDGHSLRRHDDAKGEGLKSVGACPGYLQRQPKVQLAPAPVISIRWS